MNRAASNPRDPVSWVEERLPRRAMIPLPEVAVALDIDSKTIVAWWEEGEVEGIDVGRGSKRTLLLSRVSLIEFAERRRLGLRLPAVRRLPAHPELFPVAGTDGPTKGTER